METAINPQTGERIYRDPTGGWRPLETAVNPDTGERIFTGAPKGPGRRCRPPRPSSATRRRPRPARWGCGAARRAAPSTSSRTTSASWGRKSPAASTGRSPTRPGSPATSPRRREPRGPARRQPNRPGGLPAWRRRAGAARARPGPHPRPRARVRNPPARGRAVRRVRPSRGPGFPGGLGDADGRGAEDRAALRRPRGAPLHAPRGGEGADRRHGCGGRRRDRRGRFGGSPWPRADPRRAGRGHHAVPGARRRGGAIGRALRDAIPGRSRAVHDAMVETGITPTFGSIGNHTAGQVENLIGAIPFAGASTRRRRRTGPRRRGRLEAHDAARL